MDIAPVDGIITSLASYHPHADFGLIRRAYDFAKSKHEGQLRKSGEPYINHPVAVAELVASLKLDEASICAGLLHDVVEDTPTTTQDVEVLFGAEIAMLVDGLTKLAKVKFTTKEERQAENFRKMLIAMSRDIRVILIKLADRVHNMRTLKHMPPDKQTPIAKETLEIYAPLANRLGISWVKAELEDQSLRYLHPTEFYDLVSKVAAKRREREEYTASTVSVIRGLMAEAHLECDVAGRPKHLYSIWRKMKQQQIEYEQVYDAIAFRVILADVAQCYHALGVIHNRWKPIPGRFKDYIALPKTNMYQSLHTAVIGPGGERIEIQIRTEEMHRTAEEGIAAHWKYKERGGIAAKDEQKFAWLKQLMEWQRELTNPSEFLDIVKVDLFSEEVYVFTPAGDVMMFPKGATPVDFAFAVHSDVGYQCCGARVNGVMVPLSQTLRNGDHVEIISKKGQNPNPDWLKFVKTSRARTRIRAFVRKEQRDRNAVIGRELLEKELRKYGMALSRFTKKSVFEDAIKALNKRVSTLEDLFVLIGYGKIRPDQVVEVAIPPEERNLRTEEVAKPEVKTTELSKPSSGKSGVRVDGLDDIMVRYARCCNPVPGDNVTGFVTRGRGVTVHTKDCPAILDEDPDRLIDVYWDVQSVRGHAISVRVVCSDGIGLLSSMSYAITTAGANIIQANCKTTVDQRAVNLFQVEVRNLEHLQQVIRALEHVKGVVSVERVRA